MDPQFLLVDKALATGGAQVRLDGGVFDLLVAVEILLVHSAVVTVGTHMSLLGTPIMVHHMFVCNACHFECNHIYLHRNSF